MKKLFISMLLITFPTLPLAQTTNIDLFSLTLDELLNLNVTTGSLEKSAIKNSALAITVIRKEQIHYSTARNLAVLLEQYVPGLIVMAHSQGDKLGLRGHIAAENYKMLLLVNGKNVTNMVYEGVITEIDQWNLEDIETVEVIRGAGSVTYGSGAIAAVINIITKSASDKKTFTVGVNYEQQFQSKGFNLHYSGELNDWSTYGYLSYRKTQGQSDPHYFSMSPDLSTEERYVGQKSTDTLPPQNYLADTNDRPQIKAHFDIDFNDNLGAWFRYTQSGQSHGFVTKKTLNIEGMDISSPIDGAGVSIRSFIANTDYQDKIFDNSELKINLTYDTQEYIRYTFSNNQFPIDSNENIKDYAFSQNRFVARGLIEHQFNSELLTIFGYEFNRINLASPWGKSKDYFWIREGVHMVSDIDTSVYMQDLSLSARPKITGLEEVGDGLTFITHTNLMEASYLLNDISKISYSHRIDSSDISSLMYSPRIAFNSKINEKNTFTFVAQIANRMMPIRAQYLFDKYNSDDASSKHEVQNSIESAITNTSIKNTSINIRAFYNVVEAVGYSGSQLEFLTDYSLVGLESSFSYKKDDLDLQLNHTILDTLSVKMNPELKDGTNRNNISFSDYYYYSRGDVPLLLEGYGEGLNNTPDNVTKLIVNYKMLDGNLIAHANAQLIWDLNGSEDERYMYQQAYANYDTSVLTADELILFTNEKSEFEREVGIFDKYNPFHMNLNVSASLSYKWPNSTKYDIYTTAYVSNIFDTFKRAYVSTGSTAHYPNRLSFMEEARSLGFNFKIAFK